MEYRLVETIYPLELLFISEGLEKPTVIADKTLVMLDSMSGMVKLSTFGVVER